MDPLTVKRMFDCPLPNLIAAGDNESWYYAFDAVNNGDQNVYPSHISIGARVSDDLLHRTAEKFGLEVSTLFACRDDEWRQRRADLNTERFLQTVRQKHMERRAAARESAKEAGVSECL